MTKTQTQTYRVVCGVCRRPREVTRSAVLKIRSGATSGRCPSCAGVKGGRIPPRMCRHCDDKPAYRNRGLCSACWSRPDVRELYPPGTANPATAKHTHAFLDGNENVAGRVPFLRTTARPGTAAKLAVMEARVAAGEQPHHPLDARHVGSWRDAVFEPGHGGVPQDMELDEDAA